MWLINTTTLELDNFLDARNAPPYAILSHCWGETEMNFNDFRKKRNCTGPGYQKIVDCCHLVRTFKGDDDDFFNGFDWVWIDTVCIDKRGSAELSEAINSMFLWYQNAAVCFAYLEDMDMTSEVLELDFETRLRKCRWFTRGWTLQELIAPLHVVFVDIYWETIGIITHYFFRSTGSFPAQVSSITGIPEAVLSGMAVVNQFSIAQRMSWASRRKTSRGEDTAYCLLGLFNINMPLLYGEGGLKAFDQLQQAIFSQTKDESIYAWTPSYDNWLDESSRMLAPSPANFVFGGRIVRQPTTKPSSLYRHEGGWQLATLSPAPSLPTVFRHRNRPGVVLVRLRCIVARAADLAGSICILILQRMECGHFVAVRGREFYAFQSYIASGVVDKISDCIVGGHWENSAEMQGEKESTETHRHDQEVPTEDCIKDASDWVPMEESGKLDIHRDLDCDGTSYRSLEPSLLGASRDIRFRLGMSRPVLARP